MTEEISRALEIGGISMVILFLSYLVELIRDKVGVRRKKAVKSQ
jgi:hypothetical protein